MRRMVAVSRGTVEDTATPLTWSKVRPCWARNWERSMACSSPVRSALVATRQWSSSSASPYRPTTVSVLPTSTARSTAPSALLEVEADVEDGGRVGDGADGDEIGARVGVGPDALDGDAAGDLDQAAPV